MFKNRFLLVLGVMSILLLSLAISSFRSSASSSIGETASDFHQRHPDWTWIPNIQSAGIPITGDTAFPDYHQRHPELVARAEVSADLTDYYFRHQAQDGMGSDLTDYYFRHTGS